MLSFLIQTPLKYKLFPGMRDSCGTKNGGMKPPPPECPYLRFLYSTQLFNCSNDKGNEFRHVLRVAGADLHLRNLSAGKNIRISNEFGQLRFQIQAVPFRSKQFHSTFTGLNCVEKSVNIFNIIEFHINVLIKCQDKPSEYGRWPKAPHCFQKAQHVRPLTHMRGLSLLM